MPERERLEQSHPRQPGAGILFEISDGGRIFGNAVWNTAPRAPAINLSSSTNVEVHDNVLAWNKLGIAVNSEDRSSRPAGGTIGISVDNNTIVAAASSATALQWFQRGAGNLFDPTAHNSGSRTPSGTRMLRTATGASGGGRTSRPWTTSRTLQAGMDGRYLSLDERGSAAGGLRDPTPPGE